MNVEVFHGSELFATLGAEWDALACTGITNTPFQRLAYQQAWWTHIPPAEATLHSVVVRDENGRLAAIACLYIYQGVVYFNGCVAETDYLDLIAPAATAEIGWTAVFDFLHTPECPPWQAISLCNVPAASPSRHIVPTLAARFGLTFSESIHEVCPVIPLPSDFELYLESLETKQRRELRRKLRRAEGAEVKLVVVGPANGDAALLETAVNEFLVLLQKSTLEKRNWLTEGRRAVFQATAQAAQRDGTLLLLFLTVDGRKAAALFNFDYNNQVLVYNSGLDPATFGQLSLGEVLTAKAIEWAIQHGRTAFDFLRGSEEYKYRFGAQDTMIYKLHMERPSG